MREDTQEEREGVDQYIDSIAESCEDVVTRILKRMWNCKGKHNTSIDKVKMEQIIRDELSSVTIQTKTGHWILQPSNKDMGERDFIWWKCSECGQVIYSETEKDRREYHAFCGKCGARMLGSQESEEI